MPSEVPSHASGPSGPSGPPGALDAGLLSPVRAGVEAEAETSDAAYLRALLSAEAMLARAQARAGTIPAASADAIAATARDICLDPADLARRARDAGNPVVPLVADLRAAVPPGVAPDVHRGATSQDIMDTATMLVAARAAAVILRHLGRVLAALALLAGRYRGTPMAARTLGQQAVPTTFGLKASGWLLGCLDARDELVRARAALPAQLGGAAGTLAALGDATAAPDLPAGYAAELGLADPVLPWHGRRTPVARLAAALTETTTALGKMATDVVLLAQTEVAEVAEPAAGGRGGSSAMPHKRNPVLAVLIRSAALQVPVYAQLLATAGLAEHERAAGAWHAEWQPLRECLRLTGGAAVTAAELAEGLEVFPDRMAGNLGLTGGGIVSERLAGRLGRERATGLLRRAAEEGAELRDVLARDGVTGVDELLDPAGYLGAAPALVDRALAVYRDRTS
ncbi:3-carboxy-cis,cis-muconate cycloisomerase [Actinomadura scrupuli]|uniref:3-carboxy-cis,cis-muconate cycloisomerase n=1 Tax=Actinomadura scrupuli TaxID=559629 RepID=UPI003D951504